MRAVALHDSVFERTHRDACPRIRRRRVRIPSDRAYLSKPPGSAAEQLEAEISARRRTDGIDVGDDDGGGRGDRGRAGDDAVRP